MSAIEGVTGLSNVGAVLAAGATPAVSAVNRIVRGRDDASGLPRASSLRVGLSGPHEELSRVQRTASVVDAADEAMSRVGGQLRRAREMLDSGESEGIDRVIGSVGGEISRARMGGVAILTEGGTLRAGAASMDVRPMGVEDLGAVVHSGKSHRLSDVRAGGSLDPGAYRAGAARSLEVAGAEVGAVRKQLQEFRKSSIEPAQRDAIGTVRAVTDTGPSVVGEIEPVAAAVRTELLTGSSHEALAPNDPESVFALLRRSL